MPKIPDNTQRLFSVLCPTTRDFFLVDEASAYSPGLKSKRTGEIVPLASRYVQWMPQDQLIFLSAKTVRRIAKSLRSVGGLVPRKKGYEAPTYLAFEAQALVECYSQPQLPSLPKDQKPLASDIASIEKSRIVREFEAAYFEGHRISFDVVGDHVFCFSVGTNPGLFLGVPILAETSGSEGLETAKEIALAVTILLELLDFIGRFIGLPPNTSKVADKIAKWLENRAALQAIKRFIDGLREGIQSDKLFDLVGRLVKDLSTVGGFTDILKELFSISGWGVAWLLLTLLSYLIPGSAVIKVVEFIARVAGLAAKIYAAVKM